MMKAALLPDVLLEERHRSRLLVFVLLLFLPLIFFYPAVTGQVAMAPGDVWISNLGVRVLLGRMIAAGQLPLWNPYIFGGMPLLANVYTGALYPPNWLFAVFSPATALNLLQITTFHIALVGTYLFTRRCGRGRLSALVTAIIFSFSGFAIAALDHIHRLTAVVWLPWIMLALENLVRRASWKWISLGAVFVALQFFAGDPQITLYTALLCGAYSIHTILARSECASRWRFILSGLALSLIGLLLSLAQLLPEAELLSQGERAKLTYEYFAGYSLPPSHLMSLLVPYFFGGAALPPYAIPYWGEWNRIIPCGYVGLLSLMLVLITWLKKSGNKFVWFWTGVMFVSLLLALGDWLPFGINHLLFRLPVYNLFRGSYRHWFEFTFAAAVLAGMGVERLQQLKPPQAGELVQGSAAIVCLLLAATLAGFCFLGNSQSGNIQVRIAVGRLADPEAFIPLLILGMSCVATYWFATRQHKVAAGMLLLALLVDLASFGWFQAWRAVPNNVNERLAETASVKFIRGRENNSALFRVFSQSALPYDYGYKPEQNPVSHDLLNVSNSLIPRGLQSVSGYDLFRPLRVSRLLFEQDAQGIVWDPLAFDVAAQGLNLLNAKYLLVERLRSLPPDAGLEFGGIRFAQTPLHLLLEPGRRFSADVRGVQADSLALVSLLSNSAHISDGEPIVRITLVSSDGQQRALELQAGRDTAEWAWDRPDVSKAVRHRRAEVAESIFAQSQEGNFAAHRYLARFTFPPAVIERIEFEYLRPDAQCQIVRASLLDRATETVVPLDDLPLANGRWRWLQRFADVHLYENLHALPRAWFVSQVQELADDQVMQIVKTGLLPDSSAFDPGKLALLSYEAGVRREENIAAVQSDFDKGEVKILSHEPGRIRLSTNNPQTGFLVLSEIYYAGWEAWIDGQQTQIFRTDYALRGVRVPSGAHQIEFVYRPRSFRFGLTGTGAGILLILAGAFFRRWFSL